MRTELEKLAGERKRFRAVVEDFGAGRDKRPIETILLVDVRRVEEPDVVVSDHAWLKKGATFQAVAVGDMIEFDAEVEKYEKGYVNFRLGIDETTVDYRLAKPSHVQVVSRKSFE